MNKIKSIAFLTAVMMSYVLVSSVAGVVTEKNWFEKVVSLISPFLILTFIFLAIFIGIIETIYNHLKPKT